MKKIISFGKYAVDSERKINEVTVEINLVEKENGKIVFTASGNVWNARKTDIIQGGQCLDSLLKFVKNDTFKTIHELWTKYHLNDMNAGTVEQSNEIEKAIANGTLESYDYKKVCEYLKSINMYEVEYEGKPYKYGHGWLYREIPQNDLEKIKALFN